MAVGTTPRGQRTRAHIVAVAADLIHANGLNATSAGDVMRASGTGKSQFYQHFDSRDDLVAHVFRSHVAFVKSMPPIESWEDLEIWMLEHHRAQEGFDYTRGCPVGTAAYALQADQETLREIIAQSFAAMRNNIASFLTGERAAGRLRSTAEPSRLADFAIAAIQGGLLLSLLDRTGGPLRSTIAEAMAHLRAYTVKQQGE